MEKISELIIKGKLRLIQITEIIMPFTTDAMKVMRRQCILAKSLC